MWATPKTAKQAALLTHWNGEPKYFLRDCPYEGDDHPLHCQFLKIWLTRDTRPGIKREGNNGPKFVTGDKTAPFVDVQDNLILLKNILWLHFYLSPTRYSI